MQESTTCFGLVTVLRFYLGFTIVERSTPNLVFIPLLLLTTRLLQEMPLSIQIASQYGYTIWPAELIQRSFHYDFTHSAVPALNQLMPAVPGIILESVC